MDRGIGFWLAKREQISGDRVALIDRDRQFTYRQLNRRCNQLANALRNSGIRKGDRVVAILQNGHHMVEMMFATAKLGVIFTPLNFRLTVPEIEYITKDSGARSLFYHTEFQQLADGLGQKINLDRVISCGSSTDLSGDQDYEALLQSGSDEDPDFDVSQDDIGLMMYTSGTTGRPKGAMLSHANTQWNAINVTTRMPLTSADKAVIVAPMFHIGGSSILALPCLYLGATIITLPTFDANEVLETIKREKATVLFCVPTMWHMVMQALEETPYDLSGVNFFMTGAAPCPLPVLHYFKKRNITMLEGFGMTEASPLLTILDPEHTESKNGSVGLPAMHVDVRVVDEQDNDVMSGEIGEVIARGPNLFTGYWNRPEATAEAMSGGWYHSGDLGYLDEDGFLFIVDRKKDMLISGGENVYPTEVEQTIYGHEAVSEVSVIGIPHEKWQEVPCAIIVTKDGFELTEQEIMDYCAGQLAKFKTPKKVVFVDELPMSGAGKILKTELRKMFDGYKAADK